MALRPLPSSAQSPPHVWDRPLGGVADTDDANGVALDGEGDVLSTGDFDNAAEFGGDVLTSEGYSDAFLCKHEGTTGNHVWSIRLGGTGSDVGNAVAVDSGGDVYLVGNFQNVVNFGGGNLTSAGGADFYVAKYDGTDGAHIWSKRIGGTGNDRAFDITIDGDGNLIVVGNFNGSVNFGGGSLASVGGNDIYILKLESDGDYIWCEAFGSTGHDTSWSVAVDAYNDIIVGGYFGASIDFGGGALSFAGAEDLFVAKFEGADGDHLWSRGAGNTGSDRVNDVAIASDGDVVIIGEFDGTINLGGANLASAGHTDILVARYTSGGTHLWSKRFGQSDARSADEEGSTVAVRADGSAVVAGIFYAGVDFGGGMLTSSMYATNGESDMFLASFDSDGVHLWSMSFGGDNESNSDGWQRPHELALDSQENIVLAGTFENPTDFGGGLTSPHGWDPPMSGPDDGFIVKYTLPTIEVVDAALVTCPAGDADALVISLDFDDDHVFATIDADSIVVGSPYGGTVTMFGNTPEVADGDATSGNDYQTTITVPYIGGCSEGGMAAFPIRISGRQVGTAFAQIKSPDFDGSGDVDVVDLGIFGSTNNKCPGDGGFNACADFVISGSPSCIGVADYALLGSHYPDVAPGPPLFVLDNETDTRIGGGAVVSAEMGRTDVFVVALDKISQTSAGTVELDLGTGIEFGEWQATEGAFSSLVKVAGNRLTILAVPANGRPVSGGPFEVGRVTVRRGTGADEGPTLVSGQVVGLDGLVRKLVSGGASERPTTESWTELRQNSPNPFNPVTMITYSLANRVRAELMVFGVDGALVRTLVNDVRERGEHSVTWDGKNDRGEPVASGAYFYRLRAGSFAETRKLMLLK